MDLSYLALVHALAQAAPEGAIIVKLVPPPSELERLRDVLIRSLGLSGIIALSGLVLGILLGGAIFLVRSRRST